MRHYSVDLAVGQCWPRFGDTCFFRLQGRSVAARHEEMLPKPTFFIAATYTDCWPRYHELGGPTKGRSDNVTLPAVPRSPDGVPFPLYTPASVESKTYIHINTQPSYSDPEDRGGIYLWNVGSITDIPTVQEDSRINIIRNANESLASVSNYSISNVRGHDPYKKVI